MDVLVTRDAGKIPQSVNYPFWIRQVAFVARYGNVLLFQRELRPVVLRHPESRRLESVDGVASVALATVRTRDELAIVRIFFMAISAVRKRNGCFEVGTFVARIASQRCMLAQQRVTRL